MNENYSVGKFAEKIGVSVRTLQRWDKEGILVAHRSGTNRRFYTQEQYEKYIGDLSLRDSIKDILNSNETDKSKLKKIEGLIL